nr:MAG: replication associated protein [Cressdnaviricota sp.]
MEKKEGKFRNFSWTDYDVSPEREEFWKQFDCEYLVFGRETCPDTGRKHLQGYFSFKSQRSWDALQKKLSPMHIEVSKGSPIQNFIYCTKGFAGDENSTGDFYEKGERPKGAGKRTDLDKIKELVKKPGITRQELFTEAKSYQAYKMAEIGMELFSAKRNWAMNVQWWYGPTGTGKSKESYELYPNAWRTGTTSGEFIFNGYNGEEVIIMDDLRPSNISFNMLLKVLDRYPCTVNVKNGSRELLCKTIVITTPKHPSVFYNKGDEEVGQLLRRITTIREFVGKPKIWEGREGEESSRSTDQDQRSGGNTIPPTEPAVFDFKNFFSSDGMIRLPSDTRGQ